MKTSLAAKCDTFVARPLAGEDVLVGDFVSLLWECAEVPSFMWCCDPRVTPLDEMVRIRHVSPLGGVPLKVKAICLPFVFVKQPDGIHRPLDVRQCQLARLPRPYGKRVWKRLRRQLKESRR